MEEERSALVGSKPEGNVPTKVTGSTEARTDMGRETDAALKPEGNYAADVVLNLWMSPRGWWIAVMKINAEKFAAKRGARGKGRQRGIDGPRHRAKSFWMSSTTKRKS